MALDLKIQYFNKLYCSSSYEHDDHEPYMMHAFEHDMELEWMYDEKVGLIFD